MIYSFADLRRVSVLSQRLDDSEGACDDEQIKDDPWYPRSLQIEFDQTGKAGPHPQLLVGCQIRKR